MFQIVVCVGKAVSKYHDVVLMHWCVLETECMIAQIGALPGHFGFFIHNSSATAVPAVSVHLKLPIAERSHFHSAAIERISLCLHYPHSYEIDDVEAIGCSLVELDCKVEPLGVASRVNIVLQHKLVLQRPFLRLSHKSTRKTANRFAD